ncbi:porin [Chitinophaga pendula]|nr:porin [Chitinophaga pendula]
MVLGGLVLLCQVARAQFLMDMIDTTTSVGKGMFSLYKTYDALRFSGYLQPQFQYVQSKGADSYAGGDFPARVNNRFMLRRGRLRVDYARYNKSGYPIVQFAFQFDGTERGVAIRDFWGRFFENKWNVFSLTAGMFARPFGYEVNFSSADREAPERGRMSQILMKTERDLGVMASFNPRDKHHPLAWLDVDLGVFNGQGLAGPADYDSHKDIIGRVSLKPIAINSAGWTLSASVSCLYGGMEQFSKYVYRMDGGNNATKGFQVDSTESNDGKIAPRHYYGADVQLKIPNGKGKGSTQLRAEYIRGVQTATSLTSETPGTIPMIGSKYAPLYIRNFDGAYFYFLQNLGSDRHQVVLKYDWYDPNTRLSGRQIGVPNTNTYAADVRFDTWGGGYVYHFSDQLKMTLWYDVVRNESTELEGFQDDIRDDVFTCRLQYRF